MKTIWKYVFENPDDKKNETFEMPMGAVVLSAHEQHNTICIWAEIESGVEREPRTFVLAATGHPMPEGALQFIDTVLIDNGHQAYHVYERLGF